MTKEEIIESLTNLLRLVKKNSAYLQQQVL